MRLPRVSISASPGIDLPPTISKDLAATTQDAIAATSGTLFGYRGGLILHYSKAGKLVDSKELPLRDFTKILLPQ
jgi:hypothetical protein